MGWQDRDWAKWSDEERARFVGGAAGGGRRASSIAPGAFLAVIVSLVATVGFSHYHPGTLLHHTSRPPSVVYGSGYTQLRDGERLTCTAMARGDTGGLRCTTWTIMQAGQRPAPALPLPPGTTCNAVEVDQSTGRWACASAAT